MERIRSTLRAVQLGLRVAGPERRGELLNLRWSDLDFDGAHVRIRGSAGVIAGTRIEGSTKGGRERVVSLDSGTLEVLRGHRRRQLEERMVAGGSWAGGDYVFTTDLGRPLYPDTPSQLMPKVIRAYNQPAEGEPCETPLPPARLHDLRHIHATMLLLDGVPGARGRRAPRPCGPLDHAPGLRPRGAPARRRGRRLRVGGAVRADPAPG